MLIIPLDTRSQRRAFRRKLKRALSLLRIRQLDSISYRVTGGDNTHYIMLQSDGRVLCDCIPFKRDETTLCSHLLAYYLFTGEYRHEVPHTKPIG